MLDAPSIHSIHRFIKDFSAMTILRSGTSTKYSENWAHAFGRSGGSGVQKKKKTKCKSRKKKTAAKKKSKKKTAAKKKTKVKV
ncbi:MAG TPA: hypothetical protein QF761_13495, partial [Pirellulales bacterium]|nr:hypothetical protein [Pirellulales bacterium]